MNDREMLELAAHAAGMDCRMRYCDAWKGMALYTLQQGYFGPTWNPLTDDGDALRLAVTLEISVEFYRSTSDGTKFVIATKPRSRQVEACNSDPYAAARRAITRAAAEIGRNL